MPTLLKYPTALACVAFNQTQFYCSDGVSGYWNNLTIQFFLFEGPLVYQPSGQVFKIAAFIWSKD